MKTHDVPPSFYINRLFLRAFSRVHGTIILCKFCTYFNDRNCQIFSGLYDVLCSGVDMLFQLKFKIIVVKCSWLEGAKA